MRKTILIVDDEESICQSLAGILRDEGYDTIAAGSGEEALKLIEEEMPNLVLLDIWLPGMDGIEVLKIIRSEYPQIRVIMMSGHGTIETAVKATKLGAYDFIEKPISLDKIILLVNHALDIIALEEENVLLKQKVTQQYELTGGSISIMELKEAIGIIAPTNAWVLIMGENGTGKELVARSLHRLSRRNGKPFIEVNCAAIPEDLIESELFGHEKGAFTGAHAQRIGRFELAGKGTIFLDEIAEMSPQLQAKLLRVTQDGCFQRVGSNADRVTQARLLAATNRDLEDEVRQGRFREDLFYRLNVVELHVPPLRERIEDILPLAHAFLADYTGGRTRLSNPAVECMKRYVWPGNVRELCNAMERAALLCGGELILLDHLPARVRATTASAPTAPPTEGQQLEEVERQTILEALRKHGHNRTETAKALGISRRALIYKLQRFRELGFDVDAP